MYLKSVRVFVIALAAGVTVGLAGCGDKAATPIGKGCVLNSDCAPYVCSFSVCHEACKDNGDCATGQVCARGPAAAPAGDGSAVVENNTCIENRCNYDSACPAPLVCGRDLRCRNQCEDTRDCAVIGPNMSCVSSGIRGTKVCAPPKDLDNGATLHADEAYVPSAGDVP